MVIFMTEKSEKQMSSLQPKLVVGIALALAFSMLLVSIFLPERNLILDYTTPTDVITATDTFTDIVETCPDVLTAYVRGMLHQR